jgi:ComF family protein
MLAIFGEAINLFYPAFCLACGRKSGAWNENLCGDCFKKIKKRLPPFCIKCGKQLAGYPDTKGKCNDCEGRPPYYDRAQSGFCYDGILKDLVHEFKYKKITSLAREFTALTVSFMKKYALGKNIDIVSSIPMHPVRIFKREINPSHILAKEIAKTLGLEYSNKLLKKARNTPPQSRLKKDKRLDNIKDSFSVNKAFDIKNKNILLIDDLLTTGSTVNECAKLLKRSGSSYVEVVTLARGDKQQ